MAVIVLAACGYTYLWQGLADVNRVGKFFWIFFLRPRPVKFSKLGRSIHGPNKKSGAGGRRSFDWNFGAFFSSTYSIRYGTCHLPPCGRSQSSYCL